MLELIAFAATPTTILIALVGGIIVLKRVGYSLGKISFGVLAILFGSLGAVGVLGSIARKLGAEPLLLLPWLVPPALIYALKRILAQGDGGAVGTDHQQGL